MSTCLTHTHARVCQATLDAIVRQVSLLAILDARVVPAKLFSSVPLMHTTARRTREVSAELTSTRACL